MGNIEILRNLSVKSETATSRIKSNMTKTKDKNMLKAGVDYLSGRRKATDYHTATLLYKLYTL